MKRKTATAPPICYQTPSLTALCRSFAISGNRKLTADPSLVTCTRCQQLVAAAKKKRGASHGG